MERLSSSLTFKGTILEAIVEAKAKKKLFVVYLSGENAESAQLETSTLTDSKVAETISKYCIFLHISDGSTDAAHLSAIYPQKLAPCITAIGYHGVQLWQNEGFISAENLSSSLEKAWFGLHIQEATATFLTAALSSKESVPSSSEVPVMPLFEQGTSSTVEASTSVNFTSQMPNPASVEPGSQSTDTPKSSADGYTQPSVARALVTPEIKEESENIAPLVKTESTSETISANELKGVGCESPSFSSTQTVNEALDSGTADQESSVVGHSPSGITGRSPVSEVSTSCCSEISEGTTQLADHSINEAIRHKASKSGKDLESDKVDTHPSSNILNDVHLNIRMPDGTSLQNKFALTSTLSVVKDYVNEHSFGIDSYDLAIPYPWKILDDGDLGKSFSDLGLVNRQALIVVPHQQASRQHKGGSSSHDQINYSTGVDSSSDSNGGYFAYVKRVLSFINPFAYLGGTSSSSSSQESQSSGWQYGPIPRRQNNHTREETPDAPYSPNRNATRSSSGASRRRQPMTTQFGSNIHTLKHDEDDERFNDRNAFWNGNSTQFGGNDNK